MSTENAAPHLPRPFYKEGFRWSRQPAAQALWHWHSHLAKAYAPGLDGDDLKAYFQSERDKVAAGKPVKVVPEEIWKEAYEVVDAHGLPVPLLAVQVETARHFKEPMRFETYDDLQQFIQRWAAPHARLLARLGGLDKKWQRIHVDQFARGLFLTGRLARLPHDVERDRLYIPLEDLARAGVDEEEILRGEASEAVRGVLWKLSVRARDALAQSQELIHDVRWLQRGPFKRAWLGGLEVLGEVEKRDFDVWSEPITITRVNRFRIRMQSVFGKSAFGRR